MDKAQRRAAVADYKERPMAWGVYAIRCLASGRRWVGASRHLDTQRNGLWFALRQGSAMNKAVQAVWNDSGSEGLAFEELERLPADTPTFSRMNLLKERTAAWRESLNAEGL